MMLKLSSRCSLRGDREYLAGGPRIPVKTLILIKIGGNQSTAPGDRSAEQIPDDPGRSLESCINLRLVFTACFGNFGFASAGSAD